VLLNGPSLVEGLPAPEELSAGLERVIGLASERSRRLQRPALDLVDIRAVVTHEGAEASLRNAGDHPPPQKLRDELGMHGRRIVGRRSGYPHPISSRGALSPGSPAIEAVRLRPGGGLAAIDVDYDDRQGQTTGTNRKPRGVDTRLLGRHMHHGSPTRSRTTATEDGIDGGRRTPHE
jgi:hypothetical protein